METLTLIAVAVLAFVIGWSWNQATIRVLRRYLRHASALNLELRDRLVTFERAEDQADQIARIPEERQVEILEHVWARKAA